MSSSNTKDSRIQTLKDTQAARKEEARQRVYQVIDRLRKKGIKINFHTVAKEANLSVSYLYKYPELKEYIAQLRTQSSQISPTLPTSTVTASSSSQAKIISRLKERIGQMEEEKRELKRKNEALAGQVYRVHSLQEQVIRQQQTIKDLEAHLEEVKGQLSTGKITPISKRQKIEREKAMMTFVNVVETIHEIESPHSIRCRRYVQHNTVGTRMLQAGYPDQYVQQLLGHKSIATTKDIYSHVLEQMSLEAYLEKEEE